PGDQWGYHHLTRGLAREGHQERRASGRGMGEERGQRAHHHRPRCRAGAGRGTRGRSRMTKAQIIGIGAYAPKRILTNQDLERMVETSDEWIRQRPGHRERHVVDENEATSDLAIKAAQQALERANGEPEEIDLIVGGTTTGDMASRSP